MTSIDYRRERGKRFSTYILWIRLFLKFVETIESYYTVTKMKTENIALQHKITFWAVIPVGMVQRTWESWRATWSLSRWRNRLSRDTTPRLILYCMILIREYFMYRAPGFSPSVVRFGSFPLSLPSSVWAGETRQDWEWETSCCLERVGGEREDAESCDSEKAGSSIIH